MTCDYRGTPTHFSQKPLLLLLYSSEREAGLIFFIFYDNCIREVIIITDIDAGHIFTSSICLLF